MFSVGVGQVVFLGASIIHFYPQHNINYELAEAHLGYTLTTMV